MTCFLKIVVLRTTFRPQDVTFFHKDSKFQKKMIFP